MTTELVLVADLERWAALLPRSLRHGERRQCRSCGQHKLLTDFVKDKTKPGGRTRECSLCHAERLRAGRAKAKAPQPEMPLEELREIVRSFEPGWDLRRASDKHNFRTALILVAGLQVGADDERIAAYTGLGVEEVTERGERLRANGIWRDGITHCAWFDEEDGGLIPFWLDCLVADGEIVKVSDEAYQSLAGANADRDAAPQAPQG